MTTRPDPASISFDLPRLCRSVVGLRTRIPDDALTAPVLGTERAGHAVIIDRGLALTIGYLVTEASEAWLIADNGLAVPGHVLAYDQDTGFGLVQALDALPAEPIRLGSSAELGIGDEIIVVGSGGSDQAIEAEVIARREFAGYWEYVLDDAIFTAPAHPNWGGTALLGPGGTLRGIGSLGVQTISREGDTQSANMIVPIDLLPPILDDLRTLGRRAKPARPWLGWFVQENQATLVVIGLYDNSPAAQAGLQTGDIVMEINGDPVRGLASLFRTIWALGDAGVEVPVTYLRDRQTHTATIRSVDRMSLLKGATLH